MFRFTDRDGTPLLVGGISERVRYLAKKAGERIDYKALRRGFGCRYAGKVPAQVLQKLMRHRKIETTMTYYANVDDAVEAAVLGTRNNSRNKATQAAESDTQTCDVNHSPDSLSSLSTN